MQQLLLVCPSNDEDAQIAASWAQFAVENSPKTTATLCRITGPGIKRQELEQALPSQSILLYFGHGDWSRLVAEEDLLDRANLSSTAGMSICAIACRSARELGLDATTHFGTHAYLGFSQDVLFLHPDPEDIFRQAFSAAATSLLANQPIEDAAKALHSGFDKILDYFTLDGRHDPNAQWGRSFALWLKRYLVLHRM